MKRIFILLSLLMCAVSAYGQTAQIQAHITDPNGVPYFSATVTAVLSGHMSSVQTTTDSSGGLSMNLNKNSTWVFTVVESGGGAPNGYYPQTFTVSVPIGNAQNQDISHQLSAAAPVLVKINAPPGSQSGPNPPTGPCTVGSLYTDTTTNALYTCPNGTWQIQNSGGPGTPGGTDTAIQVNQGGNFGGNASVLSLDLALDNFAFNSSLPNSFFQVIVNGNNGVFEVLSGTGGANEILMDDAGVEIINNKPTAKGGMQFRVVDTDDCGSLTLSKFNGSSLESQITLSSTGAAVIGPGTELLMDSAGVDLENLQTTSNTGVRITANDNDNSGSVTLRKMSGATVQHSLQVDSTCVQIDGNCSSAGAVDYLNVKSSPYNATCNGSADDTAALTAAFAAAASAGTGVFVPGGICTYASATGPLELDTSFMADGDAKIKITGSTLMSAAINFGSSTVPINKKIENLHIDCNKHCTNGLFLRQYQHLAVEHLTVENAINYSAHLGDQTIGGATYYEAIFKDFHTHSNTGSITPGSACWYVDGGTDNQIFQSVLTDCDQGVLINNRGNFVVGVHAWARPSQGTMTSGFVSVGGGNYFTDDESDTVSTYGFYMQGFNDEINSCRVYNNSSTGSDNVVIGVHFTQTLPLSSTNELRFPGC